jgi:2,4-dienoyl-CoA reductase-like NADH-dependent reductase (Old Yellow Enzyme family)
LLKLFLKRAFEPKLPARLYNIPAAHAIKAAVSIPVIAVGGIKTLPELRSVFENNDADLVSLCRPLILEPNLIEKFIAGKQTEAKCISCNYCALGIESEPLHCHFGKLKTSREIEQ